MSGRKEDFVPLVAGQVRMYVCGITAYDVCHVGHARSAIVFDIMKRYLRYKGLKVTHVRNITDIDDKIIARAAKENVTHKKTEFPAIFSASFIVSKKAVANNAPAAKDTRENEDLCINFSFKRSIDTKNKETIEARNVKKRININMLILTIFTKSKKFKRMFFN